MKYGFLLSELVRRDFKKKYKGTFLGVIWSLLSPLLLLLIMRVVFTRFFGRDIPHYTTFLFCGNLVFSFFTEATNQGMISLRNNASIFTSISVPKSLFVISNNVQSLINFGLTLIIFFIFCIQDGITFTWKFILLIYPIVTLLCLTLGIGLILSVMYAYFRDVVYLWDVFLRLLSYMSAIFYSIESFRPEVQRLFHLNPIFLHIDFFRKLVIDGIIPGFSFQCFTGLYSLMFLGAGVLVYNLNKNKLVYHL